MSTEINRAETAVRKSSEGRRAPLLSVSIYFLIITQICCVIITERRQMPIALFAQGSSPWQGNHWWIFKALTNRNRLSGSFEVSAQSAPHPVSMATLKDAQSSSNNWRLTYWGQLKQEALILHSNAVITNGNLAEGGRSSRLKTLRDCIKLRQANKHCFALLSFLLISYQALSNISDEERGLVFIKLVTLSFPAAPPSCQYEISQWVLFIMLTRASSHPLSCDPKFVTPFI